MANSRHSAAEPKRYRLNMRGIVQGVGFRPFAHSLAARAGLSGFAKNFTGGVIIEIEGGGAACSRFIDELRESPPPLASIQHITIDEIPAAGGSGFHIAESDVDGSAHVMISPDTATCADCLAELLDPADRHYRHPFINCTNCGPRFTIVRDAPYDRCNTTMADFGMCGECAAEYADPADRRFHAQPVACPHCGPALRLFAVDGDEIKCDDPVAETARLLRGGAIVAVKGLGGYHIACDASSDHAVAALRKRKKRDEKPFAMMMPGIAAVREHCLLDAAEERVLAGRSRPIVLLRRKSGTGISRQVAPRRKRYGVFIPYTPLHELLMRKYARPLVFTSANLTDEPIVYKDTDAFQRLAGIADYVLAHNRRIENRCEDSVCFVWRGRARMLRRARGFVPAPVSLPFAPRESILACGADLKNTFCLTRGGSAFISQHIGDLHDAGAFFSFRESVGLFEKLLAIRPGVIAHDMHPDYHSTNYAISEAAGRPLVAVQHHHAHIAGCMAENGAGGPVTGVAFDGLGYGSGGELWGGEFIVADYTGFRRMGAFDPAPLPGGDTAALQPWRMMLAYMDLAHGGPRDYPPLFERSGMSGSEIRTVRKMIDRGVNCPRTTSAGRIFDAVSCMLRFRREIAYEGQAAAELEAMCDIGIDAGPYGFEIADGPEAAVYGHPEFNVIRGVPFFSISVRRMFREIYDDLLNGRDAGAVAARFHSTVSHIILEGCELVRDRMGLRVVALSGGVFQNMRLLDEAVDLLEKSGFIVILHNVIPPGDGGISYGQAAIAAALLEKKLIHC